ncbi:hypothetical protein C4D60_Mb01t01420 [Musa balbisiana]|uniref:DUF3700 domain-containing protein n=1 Tax=Musa balbisiana TaxID=52838 RepID=A0A4S8JJ29_MUSBA|nr:hypothetical protein C4D60_Mb01t01420 [Musa balbisiana]
MLAVFDRAVAKSPEGLRAPAAEGGEGGGRLVSHFAAAREGAVVVSLGSAGTIAYTSEKQNPLLPRLFAVVDNIFCLFQGHVENITSLKQQYGLGKTANEVIIVIEAYKTLRDRGPFPASQVVRDLSGKFAFILFDSSSNSTFIAAVSCFFTTSGGLQSFEHPLNELKAMPRVDSQGQVCGATYKVDDQAKKETKMPRVDSAANWSSHY